MTISRPTQGSASVRTQTTRGQPCRGGIVATPESSSSLNFVWLVKKGFFGSMTKNEALRSPVSYSVGCSTSFLTHWNVHPHP